MEHNVEKLMDDVTNRENVVGCILTDKSGLCLGVKGSASSESAGIIAAMAEMAAKLEPKLTSPWISLSNETKECIILQQGPVVGAIFKDKSA